MNQYYDNKANYNSIGYRQKKIKKYNYLNLYFK